MSEANGFLQRLSAVCFPLAAAAGLLGVWVPDLPAGGAGGGGGRSGSRQSEEPDTAVWLVRACWGKDDRTKDPGVHSSSPICELPPWGPKALGGVPETQVFWGNLSPDTTSISQQVLPGPGETLPLTRGEQGLPFWDGTQRKI